MGDFSPHCCREQMEMYYANVESAVFIQGLQIRQIKTYPTNS